MEFEMMALRYAVPDLVGPAELRAEEVRERRLILSDLLQRATEYGLEARRKADYWEAQARIARLELDVLLSQEGSFQSTLVDV